jgi:hypothetical protein
MATHPQAAGTSVECCIPAGAREMGAFLAQPDAPHLEDAEFWRADAMYWVVVFEVALGRTPALADVERARSGARTVLYSRKWPGRFRQPVAYYLVSIADKLLEDAERRYTAPQTPSTDKVVGRPLPTAPRAAVVAEVEQTIRARDEYLEANVHASGWFVLPS